MERRAVKSVLKNNIIRALPKQSHCAYLIPATFCKVISQTVKRTVFSKKRNASNTSYWSNLVRKFHSRFSGHFVYEYADWNVRTKTIPNHWNIKLLQLSTLNQTVNSTKAKIPPTVPDWTNQSAPIKTVILTRPDGAVQENNCRVWEQQDWWRRLNHHEQEYPWHEIYTTILEGYIAFRS